MALQGGLGPVTDVPLPELLETLVDVGEAIGEAVAMGRRAWVG